MSKPERLLNLLALLLETPTPLLREQIFERVPGYDAGNAETRRRMFERDKAELLAAGVPLESEPDPLAEDEIRYRVDRRQYTLPEIDFSSDELVALRLGVQAAIEHGDFPLRSHLALALVKLQHADPDVGMAPGGLPVHWNAGVPDDAVNVRRLYDACARRKRVRFTHRRLGGDAQERSLCPYGLERRAAGWYVVGLDSDRGEIRAFKVSRIEGAVVVESSKPGTPDFEIPEDFSMREALGHHPFEFGEESCDVAFRFDDSIAWWALRSIGTDAKVRRDDGGTVVEMRVGSVDGFVEWLLSFGEDATLIGPEEAIVAMRERLQRTIEAWS